MITIDGSFGEGGGQILRTALSLSAITGEAVRITHIRARRPKPGLMRQHLMCARAVAAVCGGALTGDELKSQELSLRPGRLRGGDYRFAIGSAGSTVLLAQAVLPALLFADTPSAVVFEGGTHNDHAPLYDFFERVFLPCLRAMGAEVEATLERIGFYPAGGGKIAMSVKPARVWRQLSLVRRGELQEARVAAMGSGLDQSILADELRLVQAGLEGMAPWKADALEVESAGPGNALYAELRHDNLTELFGVCGTYGVARATVAKRVVGMTQGYMRHAWPVGPFLADQLMLPMAIGAGGNFLTCRPTLHAETNREVIKRLTGLDIKCNPCGENGKTFEMEIGK